MVAEGEVCSWQNKCLEQRFGDVNITELGTGSKLVSVEHVSRMESDT